MYQVYRYHLEAATSSMTFRGTDRVWTVVQPADVPEGELWVGLLIDDSLHGSGRKFNGCVVNAPLFVVANPLSDYNILECYESKLAYDSGSKEKPVFVYLYPRGFKITSIDNDGLEIELVKSSNIGQGDPISTHACIVDYGNLATVPGMSFAFNAIFDGGNYKLNTSLGTGWYMTITDQSTKMENTLSAYFTHAAGASGSTTTYCEIAKSGNGNLVPIGGTMNVTMTDTIALTIGSNFKFNGVSADSGLKADEVRELIRVATSKYIVR